MMLHALDIDPPCPFEGEYRKAHKEEFEVLRRVVLEIDDLGLAVLMQIIMAEQEKRKIR